MSGTMMEALMAASMGGGATSAMGSEEAAALAKALTATPGGPDVSTLTGGAALRVQSLDKTMQSTIQENSDFVLFNRLPKPKALGTLDEWTEQSGTGGFLGGSTNTETGAVNAATGVYNRRVGTVKFLTTQRQVSLVLTAQSAIADAEAIEQANGALELLTDAEYLSYEGDSLVVPTEFDGIYAQLRNAIAAGTVPGDHIIDAKGAQLSSVNAMNSAAATIRGNGNFGKPTDLFMSVQTQADFDNNLAPAFRVPLTGVANGGIEIGAPVVGIRTSAGSIATNNAVFIRDDNFMVPFDQQQPAIAAAQAGLKPAGIAVAAANNAQSLFSTTQGSAGSYYYAVAGVNNQGQSQVLASAQVAVAAGQAVSVTITPSAGGSETGYVLYRSRVGGGNAATGATGAADGMSDFREMCRIPKSGVGNTVYVDLNRDLPGGRKAFVLNLTPSATAITWRQLMPMGRFELFPTNSLVKPWAQFLFGYLRMSKLKHHVAIKNIIPSAAVFQPFQTAPNN